jgi:hypothetical protein
MIDNLAAHTAAGVRGAIEARGATLRYLPKYSPEDSDRLDRGADGRRRADGSAS